MAIGFKPLPLAGGAGTQNLGPSLFTDTDTFFSPTVAAGAVDLSPSLFTDTDTFFAPTVSAGAVNLSPSLFTDTDTFYSPTIAGGVPPPDEGGIQKYKWQFSFNW